MATDELLNEIRDLIAEREELGIRGLTDRLGPSDWADIVQRLDEDEVAVLLESIPDEEIPDVIDSPQTGLPAGRDKDNPPQLAKTEPYKTHLAYVKERRTDEEAAVLLEDALRALRIRRGKISADS